MRSLGCSRGQQVQTRKLEELSQQLLRAGITPRYVGRYVRELREHFADCVADELARGASQDEAEARAEARLGAVDCLAQGVLAQPELRSASVRHPALFFGAGPTLVWLGSFGVTLCTIRLLFAGAGAQLGQEPAWILAAHVLCVLYVRVLPVILAVAMLTTSSRQLVAPHWPAVGAVLVNLLGGMLRVDRVYADPLGSEHLGLSSPLAPFVVPLLEQSAPRDPAALAASLCTALAMLAFTSLEYVLLPRRTKQIAADP